MGAPQAHLECQATIDSRETILTTMMTQCTLSKTTKSAAMGNSFGQTIALSRGIGSMDRLLALECSEALQMMFLKVSGSRINKLISASSARIMSSSISIKNRTWEQSLILRGCSLISRMEKVLRSGVMAATTLDVSRRVRKKVKEFTSGLMAVSILEIGRRMR